MLEVESAGDNSQGDGQMEEWKNRELKIEYQGRFAPSEHPKNSRMTEIEKEKEKKEISPLTHLG